MRRYVVYVVGILVIIVSLIACEIPNYKGTVGLDFNSTSDLGRLDDAFRVVYRLRVRTLSSTGATRRVAFQVPETGTYRLQHQSVPSFGSMFIYAFEDAARTGSGTFVNHVRSENSGGSEFSTEPVRVYELNADTFYEFEAVQGSGRPFVGYFDHEFWWVDRWW
ncbi:MAG: hypothetical protein EA383_13855 [Spirochaetaceae bacterium]|nr:MAG: hypothetical protein EA383_13855 [Spirochaetaceae bacterium]